MKGKMRRTVSGLLATMTIMSSFLQPMVSYAAEVPAEGTKPPIYEEIKNQLDADEIVTANDYEMEIGHEFDVKTDFRNIEIPDGDKVKVTFEEAKNDQNEDFTNDHADTYTTVYYVEPQNTEHPKYQISRKLIVKEPQTEVHAESATENSSDSGNDEESADDGEADSQLEVTTEVSTVQENEADTEPDFESETERVSEDVVETEQEELSTVDEETGLTLGSAMEQAKEQEVPLAAMETGETLTFQAYGSLTRAAQTVTVTKGDNIYYSTYGYGSYLTCEFTVSFGSVSAKAYCVEPEKGSPGSGNYTVTRLGDAKALAKVCYYGTKAAGDDSFFTDANGYGNLSNGAKIILIHLAASYAYDPSGAWTGANATAKNQAMALYNYCVSQPDIPDVAMSFTDANVTAYVDGNSQRTKSITFKADKAQSITMKLPDGVKFHNETTGKTSAAGADVTVSGGTKFYLSAPLTQIKDVKGSWSATMKGFITKDYSAYLISTTSDKQNLALVFGEGVTDEKYVDFSVKWVELADVSIVKRDTSTGKSLAGAVYGIYSDSACNNLIVTMPATDTKGASKVTIVKTQETVYLKEITAPKGYLVDATAHNVKLSSSVVGQDVSDKEQKASLTVYKLGEVLTGATVTDTGVSFQYENRKQPGAVFEVTAAEDIIRGDGTLIFKQGDVVKTGLKTDAAGSVTLGNLYLGKYKVTEISAPVNLVCKGESKEITLSYAGQNVEQVFAETTFQNDRQKASVSVVKRDADTEKPLAGGAYALYAGNDIKNADDSVVVPKGTLIEKVTTGIDGTAAYQADLPIGNSYYMQEAQAPNLYVRNTEDSYSFQFAYTNDKETVVKFSHTFMNERVNAKINLVKKDDKTGGIPQGDATLKGAVYGLYAKQDILHPDGQTGVLYKKDQKIAELVTEEDGTASIENLYLGEYYVREISPSKGYLLDEQSYDLVMSYEGDMTATVEKTAVSLETVITQPFQIIKAANNGKTDADLLKGAGFTAYLESSLKKNADGTYDFASASPVVIGENGATEIITDEKGYACSIAIPYGTYIVRETTTPHNYTPVRDFTVVISENHPNEPQVWRVLLDEEFKAKLKITKKDDETGRSVLYANTEFKVFNLDTKEYVEQITTYPEVEVHKSYFTDEDGYLILPKNLPIGNYRIEEVKAPYGYTLNENYVEIAVDSDTAFLVDSVSGDTVIPVEYANHPVKGKLTITKQGEVLEKFDGEFKYKLSDLAGVEFEITAAEDIYTADFQKDSEGNREKKYAKGDVVTTVKTDETGTAVVEQLPLGKYTVREIHTVNGFVLNTVSQDVEFVYADQNTPVISETVEFLNDRQKVDIQVEKQDKETGKVLAGAEFGLYTTEDIMVGDTVIVKADTLLETAISNEKGLAGFTMDIPLGKYAVKEQKAPAGYVSSDEAILLDASYQGENVKTVKLTPVKKNEPTIFEFTKSDITTGVELDGATLTVLDKNGKEVDKWTSVKGEPHVIKYLVVGETYTLREEFAPYGYLKAEDMTFTVVDTTEIQKVEMKDEVPKALLIINKKGEFLNKVSLIEQAKGMIEHLFEYVTGNLKEVTFEIYAAEDILAADGVSESYYKADELVATITTDDNGIAKVENLPVGKYYVKEVKTAHGYVLDGEKRYVDLSYRDQNTSIVTYEEEWQNERQKVTVHIVKKEKDSDRALSGGVFALLSREDIVSASGEVLLKKDTVIEQKATDSKGEIVFKADLPVDGKYYVKEIQAPDGFVTSGEEQDFTFEYASEQESEVAYEFIFENEATTVEITKFDLTTEKELPGASLRVIKENGDVVDEWISTNEAHIIKELVVGETYELIETLPADGYVTAESISFTIENTAEIQTIEIKDDVTKVQISKQDIAGEELPGAKLSILDEKGKVVESWTSGKEPHYIEKLPIGKYTLHEESAPEGYLVAEDVDFEVKDTGDIQKVIMTDEAKPSDTPKEDTPETPSKVTDTPKTGDDSHMGLWLLVMGLALTGAAVSLLYLRRKRTK